MLATRIAGRVLSRMLSFGFKGALVMTLAGVLESSFLFSPEIIGSSVPRTPTTQDFFQMFDLPFISLTGFVVFAAVGALTSRRNDVYALFMKMFPSAIVGSFVGSIIGAICFASLFAMLTWMTNGNFPPIDIRLPSPGAGIVQAGAVIGYWIGIAVGFFVGTALGAWRGVATFHARESSTR